MVRGQLRGSEHDQNVAGGLSIFKRGCWIVLLPAWGLAGMPQPIFF